MPLPPKPRRALLVEDDKLSRTIFSELLRRAGWDVVQVANGFDALVTLVNAADDGTSPDVVVLDLEMPVMDGRAFLAEIDGDPRLRHLPVVLLTASPDRVPRELARPCIAKADVTRSLVDTIERALAGAR